MDTPTPDANCPESLFPLLPFTFTLHIKSVKKIIIKNKKKGSFHLTCDKKISVEFACDTTADVIRVFLVGVELSGVWDVPKSTGVIV